MIKKLNINPLIALNDGMQEEGFTDVSSILLKRK